MRDYRKIKAWQKADDLTVMIYRITRKFPKEETYGLTSQLRRAAYSVPANIAEGSARNTKKDYLHFLYIARASLAETQYFCHLSTRLEYVSEEEGKRLGADIKTVFVVLHGLIAAVEQEVGALKKGVALVTSGIALVLARTIANWASSA